MSWEVNLSTIGSLFLRQLSQESLCICDRRIVSFAVLELLRWVDILRSTYYHPFWIKRCKCVLASDGMHVNILVDLLTSYLHNSYKTKYIIWPPTEATRRLRTTGARIPEHCLLSQKIRENLMTERKALDENAKMLKIIDHREDGGIGRGNMRNITLLLPFSSFKRRTPPRPTTSQQKS